MEFSLNQYILTDLDVKTKYLLITYKSY